MPHKSKATLIQNRFLITILIATAIYLLLGPLGLVISTGAIVSKKIFDARCVNHFFRQAIDNGDINSLTKLAQQQIELTYQQKVDMLINGYLQKNTTVIKHFSNNNFKVSFFTLYTIFSQKKDLALLKMLIDKFIDKRSAPPTQDYLNNILQYLYVNNSYDLVESLLMLYLDSVLKILFLSIENSIEKHKILIFFERKKAWLSENIRSVNFSISVCKDNDLLDKLMIIFTDGRLSILENILKLIDEKITDQVLLDKRIDYFSRSAKNEAFFDGLETIISRTLFQKKLFLAEKLFIRHPEFLSTQKAISNRLLFSYSSSPLILELLLKYGADVNAINSSGITLLESKISLKYIPISEKQEFFEIFLKYGVDLHCRVQDTPEKTEMTLLGYLPFLNLKTNANKAFESIRLQKFLAMFLEIPGSSFSNGTLCKHAYMQDSHAYLNFVLDQYFSLIKNKTSSPIVEEFNLYLRKCYSEEGDYNSDSLYESYKQGKPITVPINIRDYFGGSHIAAVGLVKIGANSHLIVEAGRGFGRQDFSLFKDTCFTHSEFLEYTLTKHAPIYVEKWQSYETKAIFTEDIGKQKDDFCPAISAKYMLYITYFLFLIHQELAIFDYKSTNTIEPELVFRSHEATKCWFNKLFVKISTSMLEAYKMLEAKYIDPVFLATVSKKIEVFNAYLETDENSGASRLYSYSKVHSASYGRSTQTTMTTPATGYVNNTRETVAQNTLS